MRSPSDTQAYSYQDRGASQGYERRQSMDEEPDMYNEYDQTTDDADEQLKVDRPPQRAEDQYIAALKYRFPNRPKQDYAYSKPAGPSVPTAPNLPNNVGTTSISKQSTSVQTTDGALPSRSGAYQSTIRPNTGGTNTNTTETSTDKAFLRSALRRVTPDQQNTYARRLANETATTGTSTSNNKPMTSMGTNARINESNTQTNTPVSSTFTRQTVAPQTHESIFEKVHSQGGSTSYLGTGTFSQFEQCLRECLERERRQLGAASHITRHDIPASVSAHDYSYDSIVASVPDRILYPNSSHHIVDYPSRSAATFLLDDIRHINVALSRSGIPIFPYEQPYCESYSPSYPSTTFASSYSCVPRSSGEIVSACRLVEDDPAIIRNRERTQAVQNVWNAIQRNHPL